MSTTPTADALHTELQALDPEYIELLNESMAHAGYFEGKESHFKLTIVSNVFEGKRLVGRHQLIYGLVNPLLTSQGLCPLLPQNPIWSPALKTYRHGNRQQNALPRARVQLLTPD